MYNVPYSFEVLLETGQVKPASLSIIEKRPLATIFVTILVTFIMALEFFFYLITLIPRQSLPSVNRFILFLYMGSLHIIVLFNGTNNCFLLLKWTQIKLLFVLCGK